MKVFNENYQLDNTILFGYVGYGINHIGIYINFDRHLLLIADFKIINWTVSAGRMIVGQ